MTFELFTANDLPAAPLPAARLRVVARFTDQSCRSLPTQTTLTLFALLMLFVTGVSAGETPQERLAKAEAMFQERCKTAGEKIYRTVENVEGIFLLKLRPDGINYGNQFVMDDPYGRDLGGGWIHSNIYPRKLSGKYARALCAWISSTSRVFLRGCHRYKGWQTLSLYRRG